MVKNPVINSGVQIRLLLIKNQVSKSEQYFLSYVRGQTDRQTDRPKCLTTLPSGGEDENIRSGLINDVHVLCFRAYSMFDSSRVSTFVISILLIVYGSFR